MSCRDRVRAAWPLALLLAAACGVGDDLFPSSRDRRPAEPTGAAGPVAVDFTLSTTTGGAVSLYSALGAAPGVILYFTMWCPICDDHMTHLRYTVVPAFPDVPVLIVDYVSGSVAQARAAQLQTGWDVPEFTVLADVGAVVEARFAAPMGVAVVDRDHVVRMSGEYDWTRLQAVLAALPRGAAGSAP